MRVELQFHTEGTLVSYGWNYSFIRMELQFHMGGTAVPRGVGTRVSPDGTYIFAPSDKKKVPVTKLRGLTDVRLTR